MQLDIAGKVLALYYRVSDEHRQGDNFSIQSQQDMKAYCESAGATVLEFVEMEGASEFSKGLDRTKLNEIMALARQHKIHGIMYYISSRFTRDMADGIILRRELYKLGVKLYCYSPHPREITSDMEMLHVFEDYGSQQYVRSLREATMRGYRTKVEKGLFPKGIPPFGYTVSGRKEETTIKIHGTYGPIVQKVYHWAAYERLSTGDIAKRLTDMGIKTPGEVTKRKIKRNDRGWTYSMVYEILKDTAYKGVWYAFSWEMNGSKRVKGDKSKRIPVAIPPIIDEVTWEMVQIRPKYQKQHDHTYMLSGYARCSCGAPIIGTNRVSTSGLRRFYYKCAADKRVDTKACQNYYRCDYVDFYVWRFIKEIILNPDRLSTLINKEESPSFTVERIQVLEDEISAYREELNEAITLRLKTKLPAMQQSLDARSEQIAETIEQLQFKINQLQDTEKQQKRAQQFRQSLTLITDAIREQIEDIEATHDVEAMRRIVALLQIVYVLRVEDSDGKREKYLDIYWNNSLEKISVSSFDNSRLVTNLLTLIKTEKITPPKTF